MNASIARDTQRAAAPTEPASLAAQFFHLSLNVADLARSVAFFRVLLGAAPAKERPDYAKFELAAPPLVLSLEPSAAGSAGGTAGSGGALNHLGFRVADAAALVDIQRRLEAHGLATAREEGVECCYARQTKFWIRDPDANLWEIYTLEEDIDHRGIGSSPMIDRGIGSLPMIDRGIGSLPMIDAGRADPPLPGAARGPAAAAPAIWAHRLGQPFPQRVFAESGSVDELLLQGTFNVPLETQAVAHILAEAGRVLKPGGRIVLHGLTGERRVEQFLAPLPGPAAAVTFIPTPADWVAAFEAGGFTGLRFDKLGEKPCFHAEGVALSETRLVGFSPLASGPAPAGIAVDSTWQALYKGPFRELTDDAGRTFRRGRWTSIDRAAYDQLSDSPARDHFLLRRADAS